MNEEPWTLELYRDERGREPLREFLNGLDVAMRRAVLAMLQRLQTNGMRLGMPHARPVTGHRFWELRVQASGNITRVFYFAYSGRRMVLLHGFVKKDQRTPRSELTIAQGRYEEYLARRQNDHLR